MLTLLIRSVVLFLSAVVAMRLMGKRQVGQLQPYELVVAIMIAELAATPIDGVGTPLLHGLVPMAALLICHGVIAALCMASERFARWMSGRPAVLVEGGALREEALRRNCIPLDDLMEDLRLCGITDLSQVHTAVLETGGRLSVIPKAAYRPVCPADLGLTPAQESLPVALILDGRIQREQLKAQGLDEGWLQARLREAGQRRAEDVLLCCLNAQGLMLVQGRGQSAMQQLQTDRTGGQ